MAACTCCPFVTWRVVAEPPLVVRRCPRCDRPRPFRSSGRFRVNANGRRLDVWLVYRCATCEATWNRTVHERADPASVTDLERYLDNDAGLALAVAGRPHPGAVADDGTPRIVGPRALPVRATLRVERPVSTRLDRLVAIHLGLSRRDVAALVDDPRPLRRPPRDGLVVSLGGCPRRR